MKKIILIAALALGFAVAATAGNPIEKKFGGKSRALGLRGGYGVELSYQHTLGENFVEADLGLFGFGAINAVATYNWMLAQPQWTDKGDWGFYAGAGAAAGLNFTEGARGANVAVVGQLGLEYTFWFPLQLSLDIRPQIGVHIGEAPLFSATNLGLSAIPTLSVRYRF
jgi:opacity protein-like surface antigen